jgi:hypothetical protein
MLPSPRHLTALLILIALTPTGNAEARSRARRRRVPSGCTEAHKLAEEQMQKAHLIDASHSFAVCARTSCGAFLARQCKLRRAQVELDIPTIVPLVSDGNGASLVDVSVTMDGLPLLSRVDGRAVSVDPGLHELAFSDGKGQSSKQQLVVVQGQRNRQVIASLGQSRRPIDTADIFETQTTLPQAPTPAATASPTTTPAPIVSEDPPPSVEPAPHRSIGPYLLTGLGLAGLGGYALLTHWGRQDNDALAGCTPNCRPETTRHIRLLYLAADVSAGVGAAALIGATTWFILRSGSSSSERASRRSHYAFDVRPTPSGAVALVSGNF